MKNIKIYILFVLMLGAGILLGIFLTRYESYGVTSQAIEAAEKEQQEVWTCSMHPQIRQPKPGQCPICGMDLILATTATQSSSNTFQMTPEAVKMTNIQTTIVGNATANKEKYTLRLNGRIQSDETTSASLVTHVPGRIDKLFISFTGEQVQKGQKIASIYSPELIVAQEELIEAKKISDISPDLLAASKSKLRRWKIGEQEIHRILNSEKITENFNIYAEHSGIVSQRKVSVGDYLPTGGVLFATQNLNNLWVLFDVYENDLAQIKQGDKIRFSTPSIPGKMFEVKISFIDPIINPLTRVATVRAEINNTDRKLKPEMFIVGNLMAAQTAADIERLTIPKTAILWMGSRSVVYVKISDAAVPSFVYREVTLGPKVDDQYMVVTGLASGEEVVMYGAFMIDASAQLNNQTSMMNKQVEVKGVEVHTKLPDYTTSLPQFEGKMNQYMLGYLKLKEALVSSDIKKIKGSAEEIITRLANSDIVLAEENSKIYWHNEKKKIVTYAEKIMQSDDLSLQREAFVSLSSLWIDLIKVFGVEDEAVYVFHCPMANNDKGAFWVSAQATVENPYFGQEMLTCGEMRDTIKPHKH